MTQCPACNRDSSCSWRCEYCGRDLVDVDDDDDPDAAPLVADGGETDNGGHGRGSSSEMERMTFRLPEQQREQFEMAADERGFPSASEALRAAVREWLDDGTEYDGGPDEDLRGPDGRRYPRPDGGRIRPGPSATNRDPRRRERDSVRASECGGVGDQDPACPHTPLDEPPCAECFLDRGDE